MYTRYLPEVTNSDEKITEKEPYKNLHTPLICSEQPTYPLSP